MTPAFAARLAAAHDRFDSLLCVGLDPDPKRFPRGFSPDLDGIKAFNRAIIDATAEHVCAFKPQIAYFAALGAEAALEDCIAAIRDRAPHALVILDAKRGDIGDTAALYARHVDRKLFKMRELRGAGFVVVRHIPGETNPADLYTKILSR